MNRLIWITAAVVLVLALVPSGPPRASAQPARSTIYSNPRLPPAEALRKLNLVQVWYRNIPTEGIRDGLASVQRAGGDFVVQTRSGLVVLLDTETGRVHWTSRVGIPYRTIPGVGFNDREILVLNNTYLYSLDRATGAQRWRYRLPGGATNMPLADNQQVYVPTAGGRIYAYDLPGTGAPELRVDTATGSREVVDPAPRLAWQELTNLQLDIPLIQSSDQLLVIGPTGEVQVLAKFPREGESSALLFRLNLDAPAEVRPGRYADIAYLGSRDSNVYAFGIKTGRLVWRHVAGSPILREPMPIEKDLFITSKRGGMARLDRATGEPRWQVLHGGRKREANPEADQFLAANTRFVYATDHSGRLLVLDHKRGTTLTRMDFRDFRVIVPNTHTDRLYLAANNGLMVCLRDREQVRPILHRQAEEEQTNRLLKQLRAPISLPPAKVDRLRNLVSQLQKEFGVKMKVSEIAFKAAKLDAKLNQALTIPRIDKQPFGEALQLILNQIPAHFRPIEDTLLIVPGPPPPRE